MLPDTFLSCDWGTSRFRLRLAEVATGRILGETTTDDGVAKLAGSHLPTARPAAYGAVLQAGIDTMQSQCEVPLTNLPVVISGMASSSLGWHELPYAKLPFALSGEHAQWIELPTGLPVNAAQRVFLISGVCSADDVMRGEETELLGAWQFAQRNSLPDEGLIILPGTHSKHLEVRAHTLIGIRTYMTGELFEVIGRHSVLRHSLPAKDDTRAAQVQVWRTPFAEGVMEGARVPLSNALFHVRTKSLLSGIGAQESAAYLSGLLIGAELSDLALSPVCELPIIMCAAGELSVRYEWAMKTLELKQPIVCVPAEQVSQLATLGQTVLLKQLLIR